MSLKIKIILIAILLTVVVSVNLFSQDTASVVWTLSATTTVSSVTSGQVNGDNQLLNNMEINQYTGYNSSQRTRIVGNAWPLSQTTPIDTVYIQFTARPKAGISFTVKNVKLYLAGNGGSSMRAKVFISADSTFATKTEIYAGAANLPNNTAFDSAIAFVNISVESGKGFFIRVYPWLHNQTSSNTGKYLLLQNVTITGTTTGNAVVNLPILATSSVSNISTTFAFSGGNISSDGGGIVTVRGICWDTVSTPTIEKNKSIDGNGSGSFLSVAQNLIPAKTYYVRAYATNSAGTAYGNELSFTTLAAKTIPTVTTTSISNILAVTATGGGNVTAWGGDTVTARGICWSTSTSPTIFDNKTLSGTGIGSFPSALTGLQPNTKYYVRAYATNGLGTAYGSEVNFTTQQIAPDVVKVVAKEGGDYSTVQAAFDAVPSNYTGKYFIYVKKGIYKEKITLASGKVNVVLVGENRDSTILTYDDYAGKPGLGTSTSQSVAIDANDFTAMNITFQNTVQNDGSVANQQAVALRVNGDRQAYYNCKLLGFQDTYYTWGGSGVGRTYHKNCYIEGNVDFIFGRNIVLFDSCTLYINRNGATITAASTEPLSKFGYVFTNCTISSAAVGFNGAAITTFYLGRPWQSAPRTVFINTYQPATLNSAGWLSWNVTPALYAEYKCTGPGFLPAQRVAWSSQLTDSAAATYTMQNIFGKNSHSPAFTDDWIPVQPAFNPPTSVFKESKNIPTEFRMEQNYPNPFNPTTTINYQIPLNPPLQGGSREAAGGFVTLKIYDVLGKEIATLVNENKSAGNYSVQFNASHLSSGIFFGKLQYGEKTLLLKMMLLK